jgi:DNA mismatch repair protein MutS
MHGTADQTSQAAAKPSPMMAQYLEIKAANPDCLLFYRMGDFYELFFEDAEIASRALGIVLTKRGKHEGADIPMCGVPIDRADDYLQRLIALQHRVAVCEQLEDPAEAKKRGSKSVVRRDVVRLVTPGTITEERLLEPGRAHLLVAVARVRSSEDEHRFGLAAVDISTGAFSVSETALAGLAAALARLEPREIVAVDALRADPAVERILVECGAPLAPFGRDAGDGAGAERRLCDFFGVATVDGFGGLSRAEVAAAATAIHYVERTQIGARPSLARPRREARGATLEIDAATRANLELTRTLSGQREGSLLAAIDRTATPAGARLLAERLAGPLTDVAAIDRRLDAVAFLIDDARLRDDLRGRLRSAPDFSRALSRLALGRGGPRDLAAIREGVAAATGIGARLGGAVGLPAELVDLLAPLAAPPADLHRALALALSDDLPLDRRDGGFVRAGFDAALDETRALRDESRRLVAALQSNYCDLAETKQLKIKHNNFLGFFIEVSQQQGEKLLRPPFNATFIHRQTMAGAMRFSTTELAEFESKIASSADRALALELAHFDALAGQTLAATDAIKAAADALAALDVAAGLAELADALNWTRPVVDASLAFVIEGGRHPVVEAALKARGEAFTANDCDLSGAKAGAIAVVTGPNMAGKSTYLRQNALIVALAQAGSFAPAAKAHIGIVDRLFSRVGASDDLARGRSTFMVEMVETAAILNQASERSLVILDEIGRGTATFDGLSIAWASMEHLHDANRSRALFATHFHELTQLGQRLKRLKNLTMRVADWNGEVVFLHEVISGAADRSYGIQVAKLAGLPTGVVERAKHILAELEASDRRTPVEKLIADLPLFSARPAPAPQTVTPAPKTDALRERLSSVDPDELTPRAALEVLYELRKLARE